MRQLVSLQPLRKSRDFNRISQFARASITTLHELVECDTIAIVYIILVPALRAVVYLYQPLVTPTAQESHHNAVKRAWQSIA